MKKLEITAKLSLLLNITNNRLYQEIWVDLRENGSMSLTGIGFELISNAKMFKFYEFKVPTFSSGISIQLARHCTSPYAFIKGKVFLSDEKLVLAASLYENFNEFIKNLPKRH